MGICGSRSQKNTQKANYGIQQDQQQQQVTQNGQKYQCSNEQVLEPVKPLVTELPNPNTEIKDVQQFDEEIFVNDIMQSFDELNQLFNQMAQEFDSISQYLQSMSGYQEQQ